MSSDDFFRGSDHLNEALDRQKAELERVRKLQEDQRKQKLEDAKVREAAKIEEQKREVANENLLSFYQQTLNQFQQGAETGRFQAPSGPLFRMNQGLTGPRLQNAQKGPQDQGPSLFSKYAPSRKT